MTIGEKFEVDYEEHDYCPNCGQALSWEYSDGNKENKEECWNFI